jgi:hypothetical protein
MVVMPVIPVLRMWKQEGLKFKTSLGFETLSQKKKKSQMLYILSEMGAS